MNCHAPIAGGGPDHVHLLVAEIHDLRRALIAASEALVDAGIPVHGAKGYARTLADRVRLLAQARFQLPPGEIKFLDASDEGAKVDMPPAQPRAAFPPDDPFLPSFPPGPAPSKLFRGIVWGLLFSIGFYLACAFAWARGRTR